MDNSLNISKSLFRASRYEVSGPVSAEPSARRDFYKIWLLKSPAVLHHGNFTDIIKQPTLVFLHPIVPYRIESQELTRLGYWAVFTREFLYEAHQQQSVLFSADRAGIAPLSEQNVMRIESLFDGIVEDYQAEYNGQYDSIRNALQILTHQGLRYRKPDGERIIRENAAQRLTRQFLNLLDKQFPVSTLQQPLQLKKPAAFAERLATHVNHLNAVIQSTTGKSTSTHINERIIAESWSLLKFTDWSISEIAYALGFEYPNHFTTFYKKHTRQTPLELRR